LFQIVYRRHLVASKKNCEREMMMETLTAVTGLTLYLWHIVFLCSIHIVLCRENLTGFSKKLPAKVEVVPAPSSEPGYECLVCPGGSSKSVSTLFSRTTLTIHKVQLYYCVLQILMPVFRVLFFKPANQRNNNAVKTSNSAFTTFLISRDYTRDSSLYFCSNSEKLIWYSLWKCFSLHFKSV
jgi:hypothetical protein